MCDAEPDSPNTEFVGAPAFPQPLIQVEGLCHGSALLQLLLLLLLECCDQEGMACVL